MKFKTIGRRLSLPLMLAALLCVASVANAQQSGIVARMLFPPRNYEIWLGDTITPSVRVKNTGAASSAAIELHYHIRNVVTGIHIYNDSLAIASLSPGDTIDAKFARYVTNGNILSELGTFNACLTIGTDTSHSICTRLFGVRRTATPYRDPSNNYSKTASADIPDQTMWISEGATVVDGEDSTWDPPPPRDTSALGYGPDHFHSPVIRLDRKDESGNFYSGDGVGDTLTSFPINMFNKMRMTFHFDYMRAGRNHYPFGWDDNSMIGPESTVLDSAGNVIRAGDSLVLEFKKPSEPAVNPSPDGWNKIAAFDGGRDFEFKSFFARSVDSNSWQITVDGKTTTLANTPNYLTADFRFRFRLKAKNDDSQSSQPTDDADQWYIDNPTLMWPNIPELEVRWVRVVNPYTKVPLSQADFPVFVNVLNSGGSASVAAPFRVQIFDPNGHIVYSQRVELADLSTGEDTVLQFPNWDASNQLGNDGEAYTVTATLDQPGYDGFEDDNQTYTKFFLNVESGNGAIQEFALDDAGIMPGVNAGNDIPKLTGRLGAGIGFNGTGGSVAMKFQLARRDTLYGARVYFGNLDNLDYIRISVLNGDSNSCLPLDTVLGTQSTLTAQRGGGAGNQFWPYYYPKPIVLERGIYWIAVSQLGLTNMEVGGDISREGGEIVRTGSNPQIRPVYGPSYGTQFGSGVADNNGDVSCSFAVEVPAGSGHWKPLMPSDGLWPAMDPAYHMYPLLSFKDSLPWVGVGTYLPMIRPIVSTISFLPPPSTVATAPKLSTFALSNYPNPFDPTATSTAISFEISSHSLSTLTIWNVMGDVVKTLVNSPLSAGMHSVSWDGRDENGAVVPAGTYLIALTSAGRRATAKMIVTN